MNYAWTECTDVGGRDEQQDAVAARGAVGAVADGMGGHAGGERAASEAVRAALQDLHLGGEHSDLESAFAFAADEVDAAGGGGTTLVVLLLGEAGRAWVGWVGDSRAYLVRGDQVTLLTDDHTGPDGGLARWLPDEPCPESVELTLRSGDLVVLCTDGVWGALEDEEAFATAVEADDPAEWIVELALEAGPSDNCGVVVCRASE